MYPIQEVVDDLYCNPEGSVQISVPNLALWQPINPYQMNTVKLEACQVSRWYLLVDGISSRVSDLSEWLVVCNLGCGGHCYNHYSEQLININDNVPVTRSASTSYYNYPPSSVLPAAGRSAIPEPMDKAQRVRVTKCRLSICSVWRGTLKCRGSGMTMEPSSSVPQF